MTAQFQRLKQDVDDLENYINKLSKRQNVDSNLIEKLNKKKRFLENYITEKQLLVQ